jgi:hypothetical protein
MILSFLLFGFDDLFSLVAPAVKADVVGHHWFVTLGAEGEVGRSQPIMSPAFISSRR